MGISRTVWTPGAAALLGAFMSTALVGSGRTHAQCDYDSTPIYHPPCGFVLPIWAVGVSNAGHVVGWYDDCDFVDSKDVAYVWTAENGMIDIPFPDGTFDARALDVNSAGRAVGSVCLPPKDFAPIAFLYEFDSGQVTMLGTLPGANTSEAVAVNELGQVVGTSQNSITGDPPLTPFIWEDGVMTPLDLPLGPNAVVADINDNGQIVGWMGSSLLIDSHAFIWSAGVVTDLGNVPGAFASVATAINNVGQVVVVGLVQKDDALLWDLFLWDDGQWTDLGHLPGFDRCTGADLNDAGQVVGYCSKSDQPNFILPFLWQDGAMTCLDELIPDPEANKAIPDAINQLGQIAGQGGYAEELAGLLLTPADQPTGDVDHDCTVGISDFLMLLVAWGPCPPMGACPADFDGDGVVGIDDFLLLIANWSF